MPPRPADELAQSLQTLARTIGRARAGEERDLAQRVREGGEALASGLGGLLKIARVHAADNRAFDAPAEAFARTLAQLVRLLGPVHLVTVGDQIYVNEMRLRADTLGAARELGADLARHNSGGVSFHAALGPPEVRALVQALAGKPDETAPRRVLQNALLALGVRTVELSPRYRFGEDVSDRPSPLAAILRTLKLVEETHDALRVGRVMNPLPLRRAVLQVLDAGLKTPDLWESLGDGPPYATHASLVALVSLLTGQAAGLPHDALQDLGVAALVHDAGYTSLPDEVAAGADGLERHPAEGARLMLRQRGFHAAKLRRLRAVLDHHRDHVEPRGRPSMLGQILRMAEDYATLCRLYGQQVSPAGALGSIARAAGRTYHPVLAQIMVNALGAYPPGTLVELEDGRYARSFSPARSPETWALPIVRVYDLRTRGLAADRLDLAQGGPVVRCALPG